MNMYRSSKTKEQKRREMKWLIDFPHSLELGDECERKKNLENEDDVAVEEIGWKHTGEKSVDESESGDDIDKVDGLEVLGASMTSMEIASIKKIVKRNSFNKGDHGAEKGCFNQICIQKKYWAAISKWRGSELKLILVLVPLYIYRSLSPFMYIYTHHITYNHITYIYIYTHHIFMYIYISIYTSHVSLSLHCHPVGSKAEGDKWPSQMEPRPSYQIWATARRCANRYKDR